MLVIPTASDLVAAEKEMLHHHRNSHELGVVVGVLPIPRKMYAVRAQLHLVVCLPWVKHGLLDAIDNMTAEHLSVFAHTRIRSPRRNLIWFTEASSDDNAVDERGESFAECLNGIKVALGEISSFIDSGVLFTLFCDVVAPYLEHH